MKKKYIFLDIDGTLVTGAAVPESAHEALVRAKNAGHELILCTGRSLCEIFPFLLEDFDFDGIISSSGGAVTRGGYECIHAIGEDDCAELCGYFDD
ncbi:MAG: HAD family hydrolase [Eubacteriales bacterium]